jgi:hypothetical protein
MRLRQECQDVLPQEGNIRLCRSPKRVVDPIPQDARAKRVPSDDKLFDALRIQKASHGILISGPSAVTPPVPMATPYHALASRSAVLSPKSNVLRDESPEKRARQHRWGCGSCLDLSRIQRIALGPSARRGKRIAPGVGGRKGRSWKSLYACRDSCGRRSGSRD